MGAVIGHEPPAATEPHWVRVPRKREQAVWLLAIFAALAISRGALAPRYLISFDEINFALAIDQFNPMLHQPQPPGYPLFVVLLKLVSLWIPKIETVFLVAGLLVSAAALALVWWLSELIVGPEYGVSGALLLLFNPAFWLSALTNPVRLCSAAGAILVALCVWLACRRNASYWLPLAAAVLGLASGFRPTLVVLMAPLILWAAFRMRVRWKVAVLCLMCFGGATAAWLPSLLGAVGGWRQYLSMLRNYSNSQFGGTSLLFGAPSFEALKMAWQAVVWSCLGALSWIWAVPFLARKPNARFDAFTLRFLTVWFFPGLVFYATFHVGDPDHTLSIIPATCVAGALVLATVACEGSRAKTALWIAICVVLNVFLFLKPIGKTAKASTYPPVRWMDGYIADVIDGVRGLRGKGPVTAVFDESTPGWRHLSYYEPNAHIILVTTGSAGATKTRHLVGKHVANYSNPYGTIALPLRGTLAWIGPLARPVAASGIALQSFHSRVFFTPAGSSQSFEFRGVHFVSGREACEGDLGGRPDLTTPR